jgi:GT2 family glycosyltransferase
MSAVARIKRLVPPGIRHRAVPPLGHLRSQYEPRPLEVPRSYVRPALPAPAPTVSVVVPSLNYGRFLGATLSSLCDQDYPDLELIVCDGGSEDGTGRLLEGRDTEIAKVLRGDGGQGDAINNGFAASHGQIMAWINADDICLPGTLAFVARYFESHPDVDVIYGNRVLVDEQGNDVGIWVTPPHSADSIQWFDFLPQETVFWRRSLWERVGGIDTSLHFGLDWDLFLRFHRAGAKFVRIPRFMGAFRQHEDQKTRRCHEEAQGELERIRCEHHGRRVSLEEAQAQAEKLLLRAGPHHAFRKLAWRMPRRRITVSAAPQAEHAVGSAHARADGPVAAVREAG